MQTMDAAASTFLISLLSTTALSGGPAAAGPARAGRNQACAECHGREVGWTGPEEELDAHGSVYEGSIPGRFGSRKPQSSAYAPFSPPLHRAAGEFVGGNFWALLTYSWA